MVDLRHEFCFNPGQMLLEYALPAYRPRRYRSQAFATKNKAGRVPCFEILVSHRLPPDVGFFSEWLRLIAPPVFPPSDLDHTR
jgi:hypothetical protein